jgi:photosystem II stability/assembly factor-like uncharacterized protein
VRAAATLLLFPGLFQAPLAAADPVKFSYTCPPTDLDAFGLTCSEQETCPVFLELASAENVGPRLLVTGNLHTQATTLYGILLVSDDGGESWTELNGRLRAAALDQIQFVDSEHGWIAGLILEPLPRDPFLLATIDGGKNWRRLPLFQETIYGSIQQFHFDSAKSGELILETGNKIERYQTTTGGESWTLKESGTKQISLGKEDANWRVSADNATKTNRVEKKLPADKWETVATFPIQVGECK